MTDLIDKVKEFHKAFLLRYEHLPTSGVSEFDVRLRHGLMAEENDEYLDAAREGDLNEIADALGDQLYILCGTILRHGLQDKIIEVFEAIHVSNMSKLDGSGNPIYREDGKVLKGEGYFKPDIEGVLGSPVSSH